MKTSAKFLTALGLVSAIMLFTGCTTPAKPTQTRSGLMSGRGILPPAYADVQEYNTTRNGGKKNFVANTAPVVDADDVIEVPAPTFVDPEPEAPQTVDTPAAPLPKIENAPVVPVAPVSDKTYTVKAGDTISAIAIAHGVKWEEIVSMNPDVNPNKMKIGTVLVLPFDSKPTPAGGVPVYKKSTASKNGNAKPAAAAAKAAVPADGVYTVVSGDNLTKIANRFGVKISDLRKWNDLKNDSLSVGQKLVVTGSGSASVTKTAAAAPVAAETPAAPQIINEADYAQPAAPEVNEEILDAQVPVVDSVVPELPSVLQQMEYDIQQGDTIDGLCSMFGETRQDFLQKNPTIKSDADLVPGTRITLFY